MSRKVNECQFDILSEKYQNAIERYRELKEEIGSIEHDEIVWFYHSIIESMDRVGYPFYYPNNRKEKQ